MSERRHTHESPAESSEVLYPLERFELILDRLIAQDFEIVGEDPDVSEIEMSLFKQNDKYTITRNRYGEDGTEYYLEHFIRESEDAPFQKTDIFHTAPDTHGTVVLLDSGYEMMDFPEAATYAPRQALQLLGSLEPELAERCLNEIINTKMKPIVGAYILSSHDIESRLSGITPKATGAIRSKVEQRIGHDAISDFAKTINDITRQPEYANVNAPSVDYQQLYADSVMQAIGRFNEGGGRLHDLDKRHLPKHGRLSEAADALKSGAHDTVKRLNRARRIGQRAVTGWINRGRDK